MDHSFVAFLRIAAFRMDARILLVAAAIALVTAGPSSAQWQSTGGPSGGYVMSLASGDSGLLAGTDVGIFRTADGSSWAPSSEGLTAPIVNAIAGSGSTFYAGTEGDGVFKSVDGGATWAAANIGQAGMGVTDVLVNGSTVYASGHSGAGVFRSQDGGATWTAVNSGLNPFIFGLAASPSGQTLYAAGYPGVFRSSNGGDSWINVSTGLQPALYRGVVAIGNAVLIGSEFGVHRSVDFGVTWATANSGIPARTEVTSMFVDSEGNVFAGSFDKGAFVSADQGLTWKPVNNGFATGDVWTFAASGTDVFAATLGGGVYRTSDQGTTWTGVSNGLPLSSVHSLGEIGSDLFAASYNAGVFRSENQGADWTPAGSGLPSGAVNLIVRGTDLFVPIDFGGGVNRSSDGGRTWTSLSQTLRDRSVNDLVVSGNKIFAATNVSGVYRSLDDGATWAQANQGLGGSFPFVHEVAMVGSSLFAVDNNGGGGVFRSEDDGTTWTRVGAGLNEPIYCWAIMGYGSDLFASTQDQGVVRSSDNGATWTAVNEGITDLEVTETYAADGKIFVGTNGGKVFASADRGDHWTDVTGDLAGNNVWTFLASGDRLYAGTVGGVWSRPLAGIATSTQEAAGELPAAFRLEQNYPNPFNPGTVIPFSLPVASFVSLNVYDVTGRQVATLASSEFEAGSHTVEWSAGDLPSGVYFAQLRAGAFTGMTKLILSK